MELNLTDPSTWTHISELKCTALIFCREQSLQSAFYFSCLGLTWCMLDYSFEWLDLLRRGGALFKFSMMFNISPCVFDLISIFYLLNLSLWKSARDFWSHHMSISPKWFTQRVVLDKVHRLFVTLSCFRPDRFLQLLFLIPNLILLLYLVVSIDLVYTGTWEAKYQELFWGRATVR